MTAWAQAGVTTLAQVTSDDIMAALPPSGAKRIMAQTGLRSLFKILKAHRVIFTDPTRPDP